MASRKISATRLEKELQNTKTIRARLNKHRHFVALGKEIIKQLFLDTTSTAPSDEDINNAYAKVVQAFSMYPKFDISTNNIRELNKTKDTAISIYKSGQLIGILTSNFDNASIKVVRIIQDIIGIKLAVGHSVGQVKAIKTKTGFNFIQSNVMFRSPLSIKLSAVAEAYTMYDLVKTNNFDTLTNIYFSPIPDSAYFTPKENMHFFINALGNVFGAKFMAQVSQNKISKTTIVEGFSSFAKTYFETKKHTKATELSSAKIEQLRAEVVASINKIADEHERYLNRVIDNSLITKEFYEDLASLRVVFTLPQTAYYNSGELQRIESAFGREALTWVKDNAPGFISSPSLEDYSADVVISAIIGKKTKSFKQTIKPAVDGHIVKGKKVLISNKPPKAKKKKLVNVPRIRNIRGQFTSIANIEALIRASLYEQIKKNMVDPALNFQTGRFAHSVELKSISANRQGELVAFLTYMKYPYATFEPYGKQGSIDRSPTLLIDKSVREIATTLVKSRLKTVVV